MWGLRTTSTDRGLVLILFGCTARHSSCSPDLVVLYKAVVFLCVEAACMCRETSGCCVVLQAALPSSVVCCCASVRVSVV